MSVLCANLGRDLPRPGMCHPARRPSKWRGHASCLPGTIPMFISPSAKCRSERVPVWMINCGFPASKAFREVPPPHPSLLPSAVPVTFCFSGAVLCLLFHLQPVHTWVPLPRTRPSIPALGLAEVPFHAGALPSLLLPRPKQDAAPALSPRTADCPAFSDV